MNKKPLCLLIMVSSSIFFSLIQEVKDIFSSLFIKSILTLMINNLEGTPLQNKYIDS